MEALYPWFGDLYKIDFLGREFVGFLCILAAVFSGAVVGMERERRDKPAGIRTLILICLGSTIFTIASMLISSSNAMADPGRIAAQIVSGIGFLGAGAIIHLRGSVQGLTTGASIWTIAAIGVVIGSGHVAAGLCFTLLTVITLCAFRRLERMIGGRCQYGKAFIRYSVNCGKTRPRLQAIIDSYAIPDAWARDGAGEGSDDRTLIVTYCRSHRHHRSILKEVAEFDDVLEIQLEETLAPLVSVS